MTDCKPVYDEVRVAVLIDERGHAAAVTARQDRAEEGGLLLEEFGAVHGRWLDDEPAPVFRRVEVIVKVPRPVVERADRVIVLEAP